MQRPTGRRGLRWDGGASTVEYAAIIVLVAALAAALGFVVLPERVKVRASAAICEVFGGTNCGGTTTAQPSPGASPGTTPGLPAPTDPNAPVDPNDPVDSAVAGLDPNDPDVQKYNNAKTENANADRAVTDAQGGADEVLKQIKDFLLDVVGWTDLQKCITSGDIVACISTLINIVPWGKVFKLLKKIPGAIKLAKALKKLWETVSSAKKRKAAAEKAFKAADDILKKRLDDVCVIVPSGFSSGGSPHFSTAFYSSAHRAGTTTPVLASAAKPCRIKTPVPTIEQHGLDHSFDRHAKEWFGREVKKEDKLAEWRAMIERAANSSKVVEWKSGSTLTHGRLARIDGKNFFVQFDRTTGALVTAFIPSPSQLSRILQLLGK